VPDRQEVAGILPPMFSKILVANCGDNAEGVAAKADFASAKSAAAKPHGSRSERDRAGT